MAHRRRRIYRQPLETEFVFDFGGINMEKCKDCMCINCDANNKLYPTNPLNTCYGCDGKDDDCGEPLSKKDCLYQLRKQNGK